MVSPPLHYGCPGWAQMALVVRRGNGFDSRLGHKRNSTGAA